MLELRFDADQGCFLGQPAGTDIAITFAPRAYESRPDGRTGTPARLTRLSTCAAVYSAMIGPKNSRKYSWAASK